MGLDVMMFIKIGSGIQKLTEVGIKQTERHTDRMEIA
jgi:hypothetical protein